MRLKRERTMRRKEKEKLEIGIYFEALANKAFFFYSKNCSLDQGQDIYFFHHSSPTPCGFGNKGWHNFSSEFNGRKVGIQKKSYYQSSSIRLRKRLHYRSQRMRICPENDGPVGDTIRWILSLSPTSRCCLSLPGR